MALRRSIYQSLLINQILGIVLLGGAIQVATFLGARQVVRQLSSSMIERAVGQTAAELERFLEPVDHGLVTAAEWGSAGLLDFADPDSARELLAPLLMDHPQISAIVLAEPEAGALRFDRALDVTPSGAAANPTDTDSPSRSRSAVRVTQMPPDTASSVEHSWFRVVENALAESGGEHGGDAASVWTLPYAGAGDGFPEVAAARVWRTVEGREAFVAFQLSLRTLIDYTRSIEVSPEGGVLVMAGREARLLALPDDPRYWTGAPMGWLFRTTSELQTPLVDDALRALQQRPEEKRGLPLAFRSEGREWWTQVRLFQQPNADPLLISVVIPSSDLLTDRLQIRRWVGFITLLVLLLAIFGASRLARHISKPIVALVESTERISRGDLEIREPISSHLAEVQRLAAAHDHMRAGLDQLLSLEQDLQIARRIQQDSLPRSLPVFPGLQIDAWSEPAAHAGGDIYDVIPARDGRAVLLVADASGHGVGPALSVAAIRAMLRMAVLSGQKLGTVVRVLNEQLLVDLPDSRFITAWLGVLDIEQKRLQTFSAGQAPLFYYNATVDRVSVFEADTVPFGMFPELQMKLPPAIALGEGDIYAVLTDGLLEAVNEDGEEFGQARVVEILQRVNRESAQQIVTAIRSAVQEFTGGAAPEDDRSALVLLRRDEW